MNEHTKPKTAQTFAIGGMTCASCAARLQKVLSKNGIDGAVNFATETLTTKEPIALTTLAPIIQKAGFSVTVYQSPTYDIESPSFVQAFWQAHWLLVVLSVPFFVHMLGMFFGQHWLPVSVQFVLASVVQFYVARSFYIRAYDSIKARLANMDVLVVLGTLSIYLYSSFVFIQGLITGAHAGHLVYFEAAVMVLFFVSLGKFIEHFVKKDSLDASKALLEFIPNFVKVKTDQGYRSMPTDQVPIGSIVLARMHDNLALDGVVVSGFGLCDESHLTGESLPIKKQVGDKVASGALVLSGGFEYQTTTNSTNSNISQMIDKLSHAQSTKAPIARIGDQVAAVFVPSVIFVAFLTLLVNYAVLGQFEPALMRAVAVLVIACPCAVGLATPLAIMAGMGAAAKHGVWFASAVDLERSGKIDVMVFDKTGTLTYGTPSLVGRVLLDGKADGNQLIAIAASLEEFANHPLAYALTKERKKQNLPIFTAQNVQSSLDGVLGEVLVDGEVLAVRVGKTSFTGFAPSLIPDEEPWSRASIVTMSINDRPVLALAFSDGVRQEATLVMQALTNAQTRLVMMSGDRQPVVEQVANQLNIPEYFGALSAEDKAQKIQALQQQKLSVCMVGDGVNDALAMTVADTSFVLENGTDVAKHAASARLLGGSLTKVWYAVSIAKKTLDVIYQNLFFAFVYNAMGIVLAMVGMLTPMLAALAMSASSLCVVANSYRLKRMTIAINNPNNASVA